MLYDFQENMLVCTHEAMPTDFRRQGMPFTQFTTTSLGLCGSLAWSLSYSFPFPLRRTAVFSVSSGEKPTCLCEGTVCRRCYAACISTWY